MDVDAGDFKTAMPQLLFHKAYRASVIQRMGRSGMTEPMGRYGLFDTGPLRSGLHDTEHGGLVQRLPVLLGNTGASLPPSPLMRVSSRCKRFEMNMARLVPLAEDRYLC